MGVQSIPALQHHLFTIFTAHQHHQLQTPPQTESSNHNNEITSRQVFLRYTNWLTCWKNPYVVTKGHGSTLNFPHSSTPPLDHLHITSSPPTPNPRWNPPITQLHEFTSRQVIIQYTYWLTLIHSGSFRDIPLIDVSVESGSRSKHCRKKKKADYIHSQRRKKRRRKEEPFTKRVTWDKSHVLTRPNVDVVDAWLKTQSWAAVLMLESVSGVYVFRTLPCLGVKSMTPASMPGSAITANRSIAIVTPWRWTGHTSSSKRKDGCQLLFAYMMGEQQHTEQNIGPGWCSSTIHKFFLCQRAHFRTGTSDGLYAIQVRCQHSLALGGER